MATGVYLSDVFKLSWVAGTVAAPTVEASYRIMDDYSPDPQIFDFISNFNIGDIYAYPELMVGKRTACEFALPLYQWVSQSTSTTYGALLRMAGMAETLTGNVVNRWEAANELGFSTDDVVGATFPKDLKLNFNRYLYPLVNNAVAEVAFQLTAPNIPILRVSAIGQHPTGYPVDTNLVSAGGAAAMRMPVATALTPVITRQFTAVTGSATSTGTTTLTATGATFLSSGIQPGDVVTNTTDGSSGGGIVTAVTGETTLTHTALTGGSSDDWEVSDAFSIAPGTVGIAIDRIDSVTLPLGNIIADQPGVGGQHAYHQPRIVGRRNAVYTMVVQQPRRSAFDFKRELETNAQGDDTRYFSFVLTHNSGGVDGSVLMFDFKAKLVGVSDGTMNDGTRMQTLQFRQMPTTVVAGQLRLTAS